MIDSKLLEIIKSPDDGTNLEYIKNENKLVSKTGIKYDVVDGIPILLPIGEDTMENTKYSRNAAKIYNDDPYILNSLGLTDSEINDIRDAIKNNNNKIDPVAAFMIGATNGNAYKSLQGKIENYSIPKFPLRNGNNKLLLDIGSNWGRWLVASSREGYLPVGLDPQIGALLAAKRICNQMGIPAYFVCGDARKMPFSNDSFDTVFSYSVIQHLSYDDASKVSKEIRKILKTKGLSYIQMLTKIGIKGFLHRLKNKFRSPVKFDVRYWSITNLRKYFSGNIGKTSFETDCFFGIGLQFSDIKMVKTIYKPFFVMSEILRKISVFFKPINWIADSVYVKSVKN